MKARTRAQKLARKRGRPRIENVMREPSGRISRAEEPPAQLAIYRRMKTLGITMDDARDQKAGSFVGYLSMIGPRDGLSTSQYEAIMKFREARHDYLKAIQAPDATLNGGKGGRSGDTISDAYVEWCQKAVKRFGEARKAIYAAQEINRRENLWAAVDHVIIQDQELHHMIGATRIVGNALARHFGIS